MLVPILVLKNQQYDSRRDEYIEDYEEAEVDVPLKKIAEIIANRYGISAEIMYNIILDFDIDLEDEVIENDEIQCYAECLYCEECEQ